MGIVARQDWTNELLASCMRERIAFRINRTYRTHRLYRIAVFFTPLTGHSELLGSGGERGVVFRMVVEAVD